MGFARKSWLAVGERSGAEALLDGEAGWAMRTEVRVVRRGIEAERSASSAVWRRWGRSVRDCDWISGFELCGKMEGGKKRTALAPAVLSSSGRLRTCSVICTSVRGIACVRMMLRSVLCTSVSRCRSLGP